MKTYGEVEVLLHAFLTSALDGGEWSASRPGRFIPITHWIGGSVGLRKGPDAVKKRNILRLPEIELIPFSQSLVAIPAPNPKRRVRYGLLKASGMLPELY
jgi:hypothetical protein